MSLTTKLGAILASASLLGTGCRTAPPVDLSKLGDGTCAKAERQKFTEKGYRIVGHLQHDGTYPLHRVPDDGIEYSGASNCLDPETIITPTLTANIQP